MCFNTLMTELNLIIDTIAPTRVIQISKCHTPYIDEQCRQLIDARDKLYDFAIFTKDHDDWRIFRHKRNEVEKLIESKKKEHFTKKFTTNRPQNINNNHNNFQNIDQKRNTNTDTNGHGMWKNLKKFSGTNKAIPPRSIISNNMIINSAKKICNLANEYYVAKFLTIRQNFIKLNVDPIFILNLLIPRSDCKFNIHETTVKQTLNNIIKAKATHATGHDSIDMYTMKKLKVQIAHTLPT